jgi:hypothetical protein
MLRTIMQAFMSPVAGPVGFVLAIAMCALLVVTSLVAQQNEDVLRHRISLLAAENARTGLVLHARLAACEGAPADVARVRQANANATPEDRARQLAGTEPVGFDVCARMESADRAVLESLK